MTGRLPVVTGLGIIAAPGCGVENVWQAVVTNREGLKPLSLFHSPRYGQLPTGEIALDLDSLGAPRRGSRSDRLGWIAAREAIKHARLDCSEKPERIGIVMGSSVGGSFDSEAFLIKLIKNGKMRPRPTRFHECISVVDLIASEFGFLGPGIALATACSSGALAIATAADLIVQGEADTVLAGGADSLSHMTWGGFHSLLLVDAAGCRPFDAKRAGMSLGEGAAVLVIEAEETARERGANILARLTGWGASCDAHHATAPEPQGAGAAAAMKSALSRAGLAPADIDYVNAHGTGTRDNDLAETNALKSVFGPKPPPFSSVKRFFGHTLAASGAIEAVLCVEALRHQQLLPNLGFSDPDPAIGLSPVLKSDSASLANVMSNSFGFGGNNAVLVFSAADSFPGTRAHRAEPVAILGLGVLQPKQLESCEVKAPLPPDRVTSFSCGSLPEASTLNPNQRRRLSRLIQMALLSARKAVDGRSPSRQAVAIGTGLGCMEDAGTFLENMIAKEEREPMPAKFPGSVHNAAAAQVAIDLAARGLNSAPTVADLSFEAALWQAVSQLSANEADFALAGAVDELNKYPLAIGKRWKIWRDGHRPGEGAVVAQLGKINAGSQPMARVTAVHLGRFSVPFNADKEAKWVASLVNLKNIDTVVTGMGGWPRLEKPYSDLVAGLTRFTGRSLNHQLYKPSVGEFPAASAFGFAKAVELVKSGSRGVLLLTLSPRGGKAVCVIEQ